MAARSYPRLSIEEFGKVLISTNDLDPIYVALDAMKMDHDKLSKWLIAYWCFYSAGVASWMSEQPDHLYWGEMMTAAENTRAAPHGGRWERGKERRHFRGMQGISAIQDLRRMYERRPAEMVDVLIENETDDILTYQEVAERVKKHRSFGNWISFKVVDMVERVLHVPVSFDLAEVFMFEQPKEAALMLYQERNQPMPPSMDDEMIKWSVDFLTRHFRNTQAPPALDRPVGLQEIETVLCKWKSHMGGHYPVGNDLHEIYDGVVPWTVHCNTAREFMKVFPRTCDSEVE